MEKFSRFALHKFGRGGGFDLSVLNQFSFDNVECRMRVFPSGARDHRRANHDGMPESDRHLRSHRAYVVREQAVGHDPIKQGGGDAAGTDAGVALERRIAWEDGLDAAIGA